MAAERQQWAVGSEVGKWVITQRLSAGTYGTVWCCTERGVPDPVEAVIKFASMERYNDTLKWESMVVKRITDRKRDGNIVTYLDAGMAESFTGERLEFLVMEKLDMNAEDYLKSVKDFAERKRVAIRVGFQFLKALYDLHAAGMVHRDVKPLNLCVQPRQSVRATSTHAAKDAVPSLRRCFMVKLIDLGAVRLYTDEKGRQRPRRSMPGMHGTVEWASLRAQYGRDQNRIDDLKSWLYCLVEWMNPELEELPLPWSARGEKAIANSKRLDRFTARQLLINCPPAFYPIYNHIWWLRSTECPDYRRLASFLYVSHGELRDAAVPAPFPNDRLSRLYKHNRAATEGDRIRVRMDEQSQQQPPAVAVEPK